MGGRAISEISGGFADLTSVRIDLKDMLEPDLTWISVLGDPRLGRLGKALFAEERQVGDEEKRDLFPFSTIDACRVDRSVATVRREIVPGRTAPSAILKKRPYASRIGLNSGP